jgi:hypothetical protein
MPLVGNSDSRWPDSMENVDTLVDSHTTFNTELITIE